MWKLSWIFALSPALIVGYAMHQYTPEASAETSRASCVKDTADKLLARPADEPLPVSQQEPVYTQLDNVVTKPLYTCPQKIPVSFASDSRATGNTIVVFKADYRLGLYDKGELRQINGKRACFPIAMGSDPRGPKTSQDWVSTPEGWYEVYNKRSPKRDSWPSSLLVSYPNRDDIERAYARGIIDAGRRARFLSMVRHQRLPPQGSPMGGWILIHDGGSLPRNWTAGCIAVEEEALHIIHKHTRRRTPILIIPWAH